MDERGSRGRQGLHIVLTVALMVGSGAIGYYVRGLRMADQEPAQLVKEEPGGHAYENIETSAERRRPRMGEEATKTVDSKLGILKDLRVMPNLVNGELDGLKIYDIEPGGPLEVKGLKKGDIIQSVNGLPMVAPESMYQGFSRVREERVFVAEVRREGRTETITIKLD